MQYSKYFGLITKENGALNLSKNQFQRLMNIVFIEGVINGMNKAKESYKGTEKYYRYDTLIFRHSMKLSDLTGNLPPERLLKEMFKLN